MRTSRSLALLAIALAPALALAQPAPSGPAHTWNFEGSLWESLDLGKSSSAGAPTLPSQGATSTVAAKGSGTNPTPASDVGADAAQNGAIGGLGSGGGMPKTALPSNGTNAATATGAGATAGPAVGSATWSTPAGDDVRAVAPVPEPQTYVLMLAGLGVLGVVLRRRRRSAGPS